METIDEIGRRAAQAALAEAETYIDVEAGLARVTADEDVELDTSDGGRRRLWVVLAAAAAVVAAVAAGVVWTRQDPSSQIVPATPPDVTPGPTAPPPTPTTPVTTEPAAAPAAGLSVSYRNPPAPLEPTVFATLDVPDDATVDHVAVTENGGAVVIDSSTGDATVIAPDGSNRRLSLEATIFAPAAGPLDVLYGLRQGPEQTDLTMVAIPLGTDRAGQVVATSPPLDINRYVELPTGALGLGPSGVIDRARQVGEQLTGYVDYAGQPLEFDGPPLVTIDDADVVRIGDESVAWPLDIERHPDSPTPFAGESPPAPAADGGAVYWTGIGPPDDPSNDVPANTINVIAVLSSDGSGEWYRLPDGWSVAASDVWGTILTRRVGDQVEFATLEPRSQRGPGNVAPTTTASPPTTTPPTTTPPTPVQPSPVAALAEAIGASRLITREPGTTTVFADGATKEVATPPDAYVETDGSFLWWNTNPTGGIPVRSTAATLDGTVVCEVEGSLHRIREDPDGGYVASVTEVNTGPSTGAETPVPNFGVDCETGERQPIETVSWIREGGGRSVERIGDRTFTHVSDAEGNADVTNESGVSLNGEDYAGYHEFNADGSRVVYVDMDGSGSPHWGNVVRARDTTTGDELWSTSLERPVGLLQWYGERVLAHSPLDSVAGDYVVVLDARTGEVITTVPTSIDVAFVN